MPKIPIFYLIPQLVYDALGIAAVTVAIHISLAKMIAKKLNYEIDPGQVDSIADLFFENKFTS